ncbi:hypothetical protein [Paenibacillus taichungensis]|uniref:hypothetical protein n=1 Tax=Paenibacillus taichungensis TaxID=484184 RepID=UPI0028727747|nr:hypothetical protein [Paenibacillus taichungensis]MDR9746179.1 hypothetical protein [Paenibacillus taichungensis]
MIKVIATDADIAGKEWIITMTGYLEIARVIAIMIPALSLAAAICLIVLLGAMFPAKLNRYIQKMGSLRYTQIGFVGIFTAIEIAQNPPTLNPKKTLLELSSWREGTMNDERIPRFQ